MYYQYVFINQGSSRSGEPVRVISTAESIRELVRCWKPWKASELVRWQRDEQQQQAAPPHPHTAGGPKKQERTFPDLREPEAEVCWKATERRAGARGGEEKWRGQPEVYCPPLPSLLLGASLCQKLPGSQLAKEPEKCNFPESGRTGKGSRWTQEWTVTSTDTFSSVQVRSGRLVMPAPGRCHILVRSCESQLLYLFLMLPVSPLAFDHWAHIEKIRQLLSRLFPKLGLSPLATLLSTALILTWTCMLGYPPSCLSPFVISLLNSGPRLLAAYWRRKWQPTPVFLPGEFQG